MNKNEEKETIVESKTSLEAIHAERFASDTLSAVKMWRAAGKPHKR